MTTIIPTSNYLAHLVPECVDRLNRYWPGQDIHVLHFDEVPRVDGATLHYLGPQAAYGRSWTDPLIPWFDKFEEDYFCLWLDDYLLECTPDMERLQEMYGWIKTRTKKAILCSQKIANVACGPFNNGLLRVQQNSKWRSTLQAAIWSTDYFRYYLKPGMSAWDYETRVQYESMGDGASIICSREGVVKYKNASQMRTA